MNLSEAKGGDGSFSGQKALDLGETVKETD